MNVTGTGIAVAIAVVVALGLMFFGPAVFQPFQSAPKEAPAQPLATTTEATSTNTMDQTNTQAGATQTLPGGLMVTDEVVGTGTAAKTGDTISVNYVGALENGTVFDASANHGGPFTFQLGGRVIDGWNQGLVGMKEGGKRRLIIPAALGYGSQGAGAAIPPNSTLIFEVELVNVQ